MGHVVCCRDDLGITLDDHPSWWKDEHTKGSKELPTDIVEYKDLFVCSSSASIVGSRSDTCIRVSLREE